MIELVFVIVVIGILASVAIPRLTAKRDDAKISICETNIKVFISDMKSYYGARGTFTDPNTGTVVLRTITEVNFMGTPDIDANGDNGNFQFACGSISTPTPIVIFTTDVTTNPTTGDPTIVMTATAQTPNNSVDADLVLLLKKANLASSTGVEHIIGGITVKR